MQGQNQVSINEDWQNSDWANSLAEEASMSDSLTIGIVNGSKTPSDSFAIEGLISSLSESLRDADNEARCLLIRAEPHDPLSTISDPPSEPRIPVAAKSDFGCWCEASLVCNKDGNPTEGTAGMLHKWLPVWKKAFRLIVIDLGPIHGSTSRTVGRLCDGSYLLLGPTACGSQEWIMQQVAWHNQSGSTICGSLLVEAQHAA
jgi:hypothetical protein